MPNVPPAEGLGILTAQAPFSISVWALGLSFCDFGSGPPTKFAYGKPTPATTTVIRRLGRTTGRAKPPTVTATATPPPATDRAPVCGCWVGRSGNQGNHLFSLVPDNAMLITQQAFVEHSSLKEACDAMIARCNEYYLQHPDQAKAHRSWKRRRAFKGFFGVFFGGFLWFMVIIVLPHVIDFMYPKMIPLLCWLNLSIICDAP
jgi:hypothetical protein